MYCPSCRGEYREGFNWCRDCEADLVEALPPIELPAKPWVAVPAGGPVDWPEGEEEEERAAGTVTAGALTDAEKSLRALELLLVLFVGFSGFLFSSTYDWWMGRYSGRANTSLYASLSLILSSTSAIALLCYVLFRQGRNLRQLGLTAEKADVAPTLLLTVLTFVPGIVSHGLRGRPVFSGVVAHPLRSLLGIPSLGLLFPVALLCSAALEELIVRAFLITEVVELMGQVSLAILASVCFQTLYHLYQGGANALIDAGSFLIGSLYYVRYRRITPLVLSHFFYNLLAYGYWTSASG